jgi:hypothetical protein
MLLGLIFNAEIWLRKQTLQTLKMFFQSVDTRRQDFSELGPELLMPLLRLLSTDLSMQVLEVMEEKILTSMQAVDSSQRRGPNAQQIVRMSLQWHNLPLASNAFAGLSRTQAPHQVATGPRTPALVNRRKAGVPDIGGTNSGQESNSLFGMPDESGWSVADIPEWTSRTRINILSVFKSVEMLLDTPPVGEVNFVDEYDPEGDNIFEQNMTASRSGVEDMESASMQQARSGEARSAASNRGAGLVGESQSSTSRSFVDDEGDETTRDRSNDRVNVGDIINQLHDLSSFFIDDDSLSATGAQSASGRESRTLLSRRSRTSRKSDEAEVNTSVRRPLLWGSGNARQASNAGRFNEGNEENGEQIAKILGRSALASMMGRTMNGVSRSHSSSDQLDDRLATPTPNAESFPRTPTGVVASSSAGGFSDIVDDRSTTSSNNNNSGNVASKRGSMWVRKSLFSRRPNLPVRSASETMGDAHEYTTQSSSPPPLPSSSSVPMLGEGDKTSVNSQDGA